MDANTLVEKLSNLSRAKQKPISATEEDDDDESKSLTKEIYNLLKTEEGKLGIPSSKNALPRLHTENMNAEQIWQQIELHNSTVIAMSTYKLFMDKSNLCIKIAQLNSKINDLDNDDEDDETDVDDGVETGEETDEEYEKMEDKTSDFDEADVFSEHEEENLDEEDIPDDLSEFSDLDKDTFGDIALEGNEDDENESEDRNNDDGNEIMEDESQEVDSNYNDKEDENNIPNQQSSKSFKSSHVDSKFFNLRESEWVADNDLLGKSFDAEEDVDFMESAGSEQSDDEGKNAMYDAFFDAPSNSAEIPEESTEENKVKSKFEVEVEKENFSKKELEQETYNTDKHWTLKGEVQKNKRPENSALEHHLEYNIAIRQKPIITEDTTKNIEQLILSRIRSKLWDDVERKIKPTMDPFQFKQKLVLDEEKSKKSLATIYEDEFLKKQQEQSGTGKTLSSILGESDEKWEESPIHKEIKKEMDDLFLKLDALSNCHFTPRYKPAEVKIISNLPAITIEEATPTTISDATLLAPQEIIAPIRGELKGETEKEKTDKKRERRMKKKFQREKAHREEEKLNKQLKKKDRDGLISKDASVKFVEKAAKQGYIGVLDRDENSKKNFFEQIQENVGERANKKRKRKDFNDGKKINKKNRPLTMAQLLL